MYQLFRQSDINHIFRFKDANKLKTRESSFVEFKQAFNWNNRYKYAKTMSAFANNHGGFIVFGITDSPRAAIGLNNTRFEDIDEEAITNYLNSLFAPELVWEKQSVEIRGMIFGIVYTEEATRKPVIAKSNANGISESDIFYRYNGRSERIKYPELRLIIDSERDKEKNLWMNHMQRISKIGLDNLAMIDLDKGLIGHGDNSIYIDENLIQQIEFIKEGEFEEVHGSPTLKLVGEVQEITGSVVLPTRTTLAGIHTREIIEALLHGALHINTQAREYLETLPYERSKFMPIFVFLVLGKISKDEAISIFEGSDSTATKLKEGLVERLTVERDFSVSYLDSSIIESNLFFSSYYDYESYTQQNGMQKTEKKALLYNLLLSTEKQSLLDYVSNEASNICEMITRLKYDEIVDNRDFLRDLMLNIFDNKFGEVTYNFRMAISHIDKVLYSESCR